MRSERYTRRVIYKACVTYQRHAPLLPIYEIDDVAFWVLGAQVDKDEHDLVADNVRPHVEEVDRQRRVELKVGFPRQRVRAARLETHEPKDRLGRRDFARGQTAIVEERGEGERKSKGSGHVESKEKFGVYLRTETTRSSSSMENACVIAIELRG